MPLCIKQMKNIKKNKIVFLVLILQSIFSPNTFAIEVTSKYYLHTVDSLMYEIEPLAKLLIVRTDTVSTNGTSNLWEYIYGKLDGAESIFYYFKANEESVKLDSVSTISLMGLMPLDRPFIQSDTAMTIALQEASEFLQTHPNFIIIARLAKPLFPGSNPRWWFKFLSTESPIRSKHVFIDTNGDVINNIKEEKINNSFHLYQNFPNPFNPTTTIKYRIDRDGFVKLTLLNIIGEEIKTLVTEKQYSGSHSIVFDGSKFSSGIYFYKLEFNSQILINKLILLK